MWQSSVTAPSSDLLLHQPGPSTKQEQKKNRAVVRTGEDEDEGGGQTSPGHIIISCSSVLSFVCFPSTLLLKCFLTFLLYVPAWHSSHLSSFILSFYLASYQPQTYFTSEPNIYISLQPGLLPSYFPSLTLFLSNLSLNYLQRCLQIFQIPDILVRDGPMLAYYVISM